MTTPTRPGCWAASVRKVARARHRRCRARRGGGRPRRCRRGDPGEQVDALLPGQPADQHEERRAVRREAETLDGGAVGGAALEPAGGELARRAAGRSRGSQTSVSMPLTMPWSTRTATRSGPRAPCRGGRLDLLGVGRADGGDGGGVGEAGLQVADAAVELDAVEAKACGGSSSWPKTLAGSQPWKAMLWIVIIEAAAPRSSAGRPARGRPASRGRARRRARTGDEPDGDVDGGAAERRSGASCRGGRGRCGAVGPPGRS